MATATPIVSSGTARAWRAIVRRSCTALAGLAIAAAVPARAETPLKIDFLVRDLPPGAHVRFEVHPEYRRMMLRGAAAKLDDASAVASEARGEAVWELDVPESGSTAPEAHVFSFPIEMDRSATDRKEIIRLGITFQIEPAFGREKPGAYAGYGQPHEIVLAMPVPRSSAPLERCLRLRQAGDRLVAESAADCEEASFAKSKASRLSKPAPSPR
jgi:hypothetical protein